MALTILILAISRLLIRCCDQTWNIQFFDWGRNRNLGVGAVTYVPNRDMMQGRRIFSHGDVIRKHRQVASTLYNIGVALINMRMYIRR